MPRTPTEMDDHQQARLILAVLRERWSEAEELVRDGFPDAESFVTQCRHCEVPSWIHHRLETADAFHLVGKQGHDRLSSLRKKIRNDNLLLLARLESALDSLAERGVTPIALKGADTLHRFYGGFDRRMIVDIDLLCRRDDIVASLEAFEAVGWRSPDEPERSRFVRGSHHLPLHGPGPIPVDLELHWNIVQERRYTVDVDGLFERAVPMEVAGRPALRLEDHDFVAHSLLHHFSHYFGPGLKGLVDLQFVTSQDGFDWNAVVSRIRSWGGTVAAGAAVAHIRRLWPELIPDRIVRMMPLSSWRRFVTSPLRSDHPLELFRKTRNRRVQLYLAAVMLESPAALPGWLLHRFTRDRRSALHPLDRA